MVLLLVPVEAVLAAAPGLGVQQLLHPGAGVRLAVGEVRRIAQVQPHQPAVLELVRAERPVPAAVVRVQRRRVARVGQVRHQRLVERLEAYALGLGRPGRRGGGAVPAHPRGRGDQRGDTEDRPVRHHRHDHDRRDGQQQRRSAPVLRGAAPPPAGPGRLPAHASGDGDDGVQHVAGAVGRGARQITAADERRSGAEDAGKGTPGHGLLHGWFGWGTAHGGRRCAGDTRGELRGTRLGGSTGRSGARCEVRGCARERGLGSGTATGPGADRPLPGPRGRGRSGRRGRR